VIALEALGIEPGDGEIQTLGSFRHDAASPWAIDG
jgi:hypothetical protein